eukprot:130619_1
MSLINFQRQPGFFPTAFDDDNDGWLNLFRGGQFADTDRRFGAPLDVKECKDTFEITVDVPGIPKENVKVFLEDQVLTISGERKEETCDEGESFRCRERSSKTFRRSFRLPSPVSTKGVVANYEHG